MTAPSMARPVVTYFHSATSNLRAKATISAFLTRPPLALRRSSNHSVKAGSGLMAPPQPSQFDEGCAQAGIAGLGGALFLLDASAAPWRGREPGIGCELTPIAEGPEQSLEPQPGRELGPHALECEQHPRHGRLTAWLGQQRVAFGLDRLDLGEQQLETVELAADQALQPERQSRARAREQRLEPGAPVAAQRLVVEGPLREQEALDPIDVFDAFGDQGLALAPEPPAILLLGARRLGHCADLGLAAPEGHQRAKQRLAVDAVGLGPSAPARHGDRSRVDNVAFNPLALQRPVNPEH